MSNAITLTRGEQNQNPLNLDYVASIPWLGQTGIEFVPPGSDFTPRFARFSASVYGIRAGMRNLERYIISGVNTVEKIISTWAPGSENDTAAYIADVAQRTGFIADDEELSANAATLLALANAIIIHENGRNIYPAQTMEQAVTMALQ